jgi:heptose-I-phosphate ethanolaminephosphotransferase
MPDHGEEVFDELKTFGRLHDTVISKEMAKNEFQIPFWIYCSNRYQELHPIIVESIKNATNRRFFSDDLPHLLLYLGGITCRGYRESCNILKQNFDINRKRLLRGQIDYDKITHDP